MHQAMAIFPIRLWVGHIEAIVGREIIIAQDGRGFVHARYIGELPVKFRRDLLKSLQQGRSEYKVNSQVQQDTLFSLHATRVSSYLQYNGVGIGKLVRIVTRVVAGNYNEIRVGKSGFG
jgi:hypothetical protein